MRKEAPLLFIKMGGLVSLRVKNNIMQNERPDPKGFYTNALETKGKNCPSARLVI
jgi:hypothetical protein